MEMFMKKILIATAALSLMCGSAFAQSTDDPIAKRYDMKKPESTDKGSKKKGTTDMSSDRSGTAPDASGQGGSGLGSDQGGAKVYHLKKMK
jgi:hypothetical protein